MEPIIAIHKPKGPTSHDIVAQIRKITGEKKVGHAGTLDPLASGVLVVGIGREGTKQLRHIVEKEKEYLATILLGATSITDDAEGEKTAIDVATPPSEATVRETLKHFVGTIQQVPPQYSAGKISGKEAYKYARAGQHVTLGAGTVDIFSIEFLEYAWPIVRCRVVTGPGVYIRSLARDLGERLGTGGYLADLERTRVGQYTLEDAIAPEALEKKNPATL